VLIRNASGELTGRPAERLAAVATLAYAPDGHLAGGFGDGQVRVWAPDGRLVHLLTEHTQPISAVAFAPDGRLAVGARDDTVGIWDLACRLATTTATTAAPALAFTTAPGDWPRDTLTAWSASGTPASVRGRWPATTALSPRWRSLPPG
jgi:WD40 repeat protein